MLRMVELNKRSWVYLTSVGVATLTAGLATTGKDTNTICFTREDRHPASTTFVCTRDTLKQIVDTLTNMADSNIFYHPESPVSASGPMKRSSDEHRWKFETSTGYVYMCFDKEENADVSCGKMYNGYATSSYHMDAPAADVLWRVLSALAEIRSSECDEDEDEVEEC